MIKKRSLTKTNIPPLAEQRRIAARVDQLLALVDQLETHLAISRFNTKNPLHALVAEWAKLKHNDINDESQRNDYI